ncbi:19041_t:CDS:2, partial [Gigaspora rosea]
ISHAIKHYVRIGYDILEGSDIVDAAKELSGTYFANIQPNRAKKEINQLDNDSKKINNDKKKSLFAGYIQARPMPNFGELVHFTPATIANLCNNKIFSPEP